MIYAGAGNPAYHPRILMKILVQGMLHKVDHLENLQLQQEKMWC